MAIARKPGWIVLAVMLALYAGVGLGLPLALGWPALHLAGANVIGTTLAALVFVTWLAVQVQARDRRHLIEWTSDLRLLDAEEFEWFIGELFRREGWKVEETGRQDGPDGNIDLRLERGGTKRLVQVKRWTSRFVPVIEVRQFAGTLARERVGPANGIFVTLSDFTPQARVEAHQLGLELIDRRDLYAMVERLRRSEPCPRCGTSMVLDRSVHGWWFRCVTADCTGKRDLGRSPARAVELLTDQS